MSYTLVCVADLISTGITPHAKLFGVDGAQVGATIESGIVETLPRLYVCKATIDDGQEGLFVIYDPADTTDRVGFSVDPKEGEYTNASISAVKAKTDNLPSDPADESSIQATLATIAAYIDTEVAAIKAKTDNLPSDPADESSIQASIATLSAAVTVIDNFLDTEIATMPADVWSYATRTLTMTAAQITAAMEGEPLPIYKSVTFNFTFTGLTIPADWLKIWFTLKKSRSTVDSLADIQIVITNGGDAGDGISVLNAAASTVTTKPYGALVINQAAGTAALTIQDDATALMTGKYSTQHLGVYDLKVKDASGATVILTESTATLEWAVTRQI